MPHRDGKGRRNELFDMKASDLFVKALENEGVEFIFGIPGEDDEI